MAVKGGELKYKLYLFIIFVMLSIISFTKGSEDLRTSKKIISKYESNVCRFNKKGLIFKKYMSEYFRIEGYWKKDIPYGRWIEKTYTGIIMSDQCYLYNKKILKSYSQGMLTKIIYLDDQYEIYGLYDNESNLHEIIYITKDNIKKYRKINGIWEKKENEISLYLPEPIIELYNIDKEKIKINSQ